eukprot:763656-Hanusia_phi.AAC.2
MIRFQISRQDASRLGTSSPPAEVSLGPPPGDEDAAGGFDAPALGVEMLSAGGAGSHSALTQKLQASLPPQVPITDRAMERRLVPSAPAEVMAGGGREAQGQEAPERKLTVVKSKGSHDLGQLNPWDLSPEQVGGGGGEGGGGGGEQEERMDSEREGREGGMRT